MNDQTSAGEVVIQALVFLSATCLVIPALRKARLSAVMGFLLIGVAMGPHVLGQLAETWRWLSPFELEESEPTRLLAELGILFLLFVIGLEVSWERLWSLKRYVFGLGLAQVVVTAAVITAVAMTFSDGFATAAVLGLAFTLSSTALVLQLLRERRQNTAPIGRVSLAVLLTQDLMVAPVLFAVSALSAGAAAFGAHQIGFAVGSGLGALAVIVLVGRLVLRPLFRWVASIDSREVFIAAAMLAAIGMSLAAEASGLSMALGAFLAGMLLAETEFRHQIETDLEPFKDLLLGLFFVTVGMEINLEVLFASPLPIILGVLGLFALKVAILAPLARAVGVPWPRAVELAFLLGQVGEFAFIVVAAARAGGVIAEDTAEIMLLVTALSIFITPGMAALGRMIAQRIPQQEAQAPMAETAQLRDHVVIAGCGRVGTMLAEILDRENIVHVGVDSNAAVINALRGERQQFYFGDASRRDVLAAVGAANAAAIVVTMDQPDAVQRVVEAAKAAWPETPIYARARDADHARRLRAAGAALASPDTMEAALQLGEALLTGVGVPDEAARRIIEERRETELARAAGS